MTHSVEKAAPAWVHDLAFIAAVGMPDAWASATGTTVNGMWASPHRWDAESVEEAHRKGRRILVSVPLIALTHEVYENPETAYLCEEVCRDIDGNPAEVEWYYWDAKPVYSLCVHSPVLHRYLVDSLRPAIEAGIDVVNIDEINTSIGLMTRRPKGSGFCRLCLRGSEALRMAATTRGSADASDDDLRRWLRDDDALFAAYAEEQRSRAFAEASTLLEQVRDVARRAGHEVALTANVAGLGAFVGNHGPLWSAMWGELLDVMMLEAIYVVSQSQFEDPHAHKLLPRGTFAALYRLGRAIGPKAPIWIAPQINVPRQLAGQRRLRYYESMFLEAYANLGRWGYNWWPGVDDEARRAATVPDSIAEWSRYFREHREDFVDLATENGLAIVYSNAAVLREPLTHYRYLGLAQALYERGIQFDVVYAGDDRFGGPELGEAAAGYARVIIPGADYLSADQRRDLDRMAGSGASVTAIGAGNRELESTIDRFWAEYDAGDGDRIVTACSIPPRDIVRVSTPRVVPIRYRRADGTTIVHLLNYAYRPEEDGLERAVDVTVTVAEAHARGAVARTRGATVDLAIAPVPEGVAVVVPELVDHTVVELVP